MKPKRNILVRNWWYEVHIYHINSYRATRSFHTKAAAIAAVRDCRKMYPTATVQCARVVHESIPV